MLLQRYTENYTKKTKILSHCSFIPLKITNFATILYIFLMLF